MVLARNQEYWTALLKEWLDWARINTLVKHGKFNDHGWRKMDMTEKDVKLADMPPDILSKIVKISVSLPLHHMMLHSATQGLDKLLIKNIN